MFEWILVPVDLAEREMRGIEVARRLAARGGARIALVYVESQFASVQEKTRDGGVLRRLAEPLWDAGVEAYYGLETGRPETTIADVAHELRPDVVLVAPPAHEGLDRLLHRSITLAMFAQTPAPVLVWPPRLSVERANALLGRAASRVVVPLDGGELAEGALSIALSFARAYGRTLLLVRVVPPFGGMDAGRGRSSAEERAEEEAIDYIGTVRHRLAREAPDVPVEYAVLSGATPAAAILSAGQEADGTSLVVMSTHGRTRFERAVVGSVTADVVRRASVPILVVPPAANPGWPESATEQDEAAGQADVGDHDS